MAARRTRRQIESRRLVARNEANADPAGPDIEDDEDDKEDEEDEEEDEEEEDPITKQFIPEITFCGFTLV